MGHESRRTSDGRSKETILTTDPERVTALVDAGEVAVLVAGDRDVPGDRIRDSIDTGVRTLLNGLADLDRETGAERERLRADGGRVVESETCSNCEERTATVSGLCTVCERENRDGMVTDGGKTVPRPHRGESFGLPDRIAAVIPGRPVSIEARSVLKRIQLGRRTVERVLERAKGARHPHDVSASDYLSVLDHADGELALISSSNTGLTVIGRVNDDVRPYEVWTYSAVDEKLGLNPYHRETVDRREIKERLEWSDPSVVLRSETPLDGGL